MQRGIYIDLNGVNRYMIHNLIATDIAKNDIDGDFINIIRSGGEEGLNALFSLAAAMLEGGELVRRYLGYEPVNILSKADLLSEVYADGSLIDVIKLKGYVFEALFLANKTEKEQKKGEVVDLTLQRVLREKNKDKENDTSFFINMAIVSGMAHKEALLSTRATIHENFKLYTKLNIPRL